jgi:hypothetical protein
VNRIRKSDFIWWPAYWLWGIMPNCKAREQLDNWLIARTEYTAGIYD